MFDEHELANGNYNSGWKIGEWNLNIWRSEPGCENERLCAAKLTVFKNIFDCAV